MKLRIHGDQAVAPGEKYGSYDEPPAALRVGQPPWFPENTVQQRLKYAPEYQLLCEPGHNQEEGPAPGVQFLASPKKEEDRGHRQS